MSSKAPWRTSYAELEAEAELAPHPGLVSRLRDLRVELQIVEPGSPQHKSVMFDIQELEARLGALSAVLEVLQEHGIPWRRIPYGYQFLLPDAQIFQWWPRSDKCAVQGGGAYTALYGDPARLLAQHAARATRERTTHERG